MCGSGGSGGSGRLRLHTALSQVTSTTSITEHNCNAMQVLSSLAVALLAGYAHAFVLPSVPVKNTFVQQKPAQAASSLEVATPIGSPQMKIAIVTVRETYTVSLDAIDFFLPTANVDHQHIFVVHKLSEQMR